MTVSIVESWEQIAVSSDFPRTRTVRSLFFRLSCGCIAKIDTPILLATCSNRTLTKAFEQLAELHQCPTAGPSPSPEPPLQLGQAPSSGSSGGP